MTEREEKFNRGYEASEAGDYAQALKIWLDMAEQGDADAQIAVAGMHARGRGVPQDYAEAIRWYSLAAEQGDADAQFNLGQMHECGMWGVVPKDYGKAMKWYLLAAEQGEPDAQFNLADMYVRGRGVPEDLVHAHMWFNLSGAGGNEAARKERDTIEKRMTADQIVEARMLAYACTQGDTED